MVSLAGRSPSGVPLRKNWLPRAFQSASLGTRRTATDGPAVAAGYKSYSNQPQSGEDSSETGYSTRHGTPEFRQPEIARAGEHQGPGQKSKRYAGPGQQLNADDGENDSCLTGNDENFMKFCDNLKNGDYD